MTNAVLVLDRRCLRTLACARGTDQDETLACRGCGLLDRVDGIADFTRRLGLNLRDLVGELESVVSDVGHDEMGTRPE